MNAKDKEKLNMAGTIVSLLKGDTIVIDPDEFRRRADIKNKEFYEVEKDTGCKVEKKVPGLTDAEMLCCDIAIHIAHKTAARFEDMADGMEMSTLKQIVRRIEDCLESVVSRGIGRNASIYGVQVGGKTGTTNDNYDYWFVGFTPKYSAALWIGTDHNTVMSGSSGTAALLWSRIMRQIPDITEGEYPPQPDDVVWSRGEYYTEKTQP